MLIPPGPVRVLVAMKPVDFRKGMNGLAALVQEQLKADPFSGTIYCFRSKRADRVKLVFWDGTGLCVQASGGRQVPLAARAGWRDAFVCGAVERASRRPRLEPRACAQSGAAASSAVTCDQLNHPQESSPHSRANVI
jgi:hypothetical protein